MSVEPATLARVEAIFHEALELPAQQRDEYIDRRCGDDRALAAEVRSLIQASESESALGRERAASARATRTIAARGRRIGAYEIDRLLGRGGMGSVYLAHRVDGEFEQQVAIKLVDLPMASELFRERFRVERQILANLTHPCIARLLDGGVSEGGEMFLAMEYIDGVNIAAYCRAHRLSIRERITLFLKVCGAVQFAHQSLVVHRDLKPDNILIATDGTPRLLDFGTAKLLTPLSGTAAAGFTQHGIQAFTPSYASPEQILGEPISTATDVYSLGVLLYVLLAGVPPYSIQNFTTGEFLRLVCTEQPPPPSVAAKRAGTGVRLDADLDVIVLKALRKEPQQRYLSVEQLAADLLAYASGRPVAARRGNYRYRALKFVRRNALPVAIASVLAATLVLGAVAVFWQWHIANQQRQRAEARSEDLRQLSSSLLAEIDEAIKELPGSTPVQRLLVDRVLHHLDHLAGDPADVATTLDIVAGYTRLGNLQGNPYEQNIGDPNGGLSSLDRAIRLAQQLNVQQPKDARILAALATAEQSQGEVLFGIGKTQGAIDSMRKSIADYDARDRLPGTGAAALAESASAVGALGDLLGQSGVSSLGDDAGAIAAYRKALDLCDQALRLEPGYVRAQRGVAIDHLKIGNIKLTTDPPAASREYALSLRAWLALPAPEQSTISTRRGIAQTHIKIAAAAAAMDEYERAQQELELATPTMEYLATADAGDSRVTYDLASFYVRRASTYVDQIDAATGKALGEARPIAQRAIDQMNRALPLLERLAALQPGNVSWAANLAQSRVTLGSLTTRFGLGNGSPLAKLGMTTLSNIARLPDANIDVLECAVRAGLEAEPPELRSTHRTVELAQRLADATQRHNPEHLWLLARALRADGQRAPAVDVATHALGLMPDPAADKPSRLRRLLVSQTQQ
ncbi:MAG: serine/threonine-protein kinase [Gammaproteobacteria bacterium]